MEVKSEWQGSVCAGARGTCVCGLRHPQGDLLNASQLLQLKVFNMGFLTRYSMTIVYVEPIGKNGQT